MLTKKESPKNEKPTKNSKTAPALESNEQYAPAKAPTQQPAKVYSSSKNTDSLDHYPPAFDRKTQQKTRLTIKYDVGYNNQLYIRGKGANLNWEKGQPLKNVKADEWTWETDQHFSQCEFKILINDRTYEQGDNHLINCGASMTYTPHF
ncbi:hypothetical protein [Candidatus Protochlamydia phocaeensis]|uniref:hypothetical protein n=1 Tax=Candidatus Protochlamydia phocaeensis TaxID=1414722 RepID=UPI000838B23E|nr:hypothetical protein [Candidatus Protochlamydia phocaeensis]